MVEPTFTQVECDQNKDTINLESSALNGLRAFAAIQQIPRPLGERCWPSLALSSSSAGRRSSTGTGHARFTRLTFIFDLSVGLIV